MSSNATLPSAATAAMFQLQPDEVRMWSLDVVAVRPVLEACETWLTAEERQRMQRMRAGLAREEFIVGRACLRALLTLVLLLDPREVELTTSSNGKPQIDGVEFNVAHSHGEVWIAMCRSAVVGVDVERIDTSIEAVDIAGENFTASERAIVQIAAAGDDRARIFYRTWTRKEAIVKAHGGGLSLALAAIETGGEALESAVSFRDGRGDSCAYFVRDINTSEGFAAALAVSRRGLAMRNERLNADSLKLLLEICRRPLQHSAGQ